MGGAEGTPTNEARARAKVRYLPVFELGTGRLAGADAALAAWAGHDGADGSLDDRGLAGDVATLVRSVVADLSEGPAAVDRWWVRVEIGLGPLVDRLLGAELMRVQGDAGVVAGRLRFGVEHDDLAFATVAGGVDHLTRHGARFDVTGLRSVPVASTAMRIPVAAVRVAVADLDPAALEARSALRSVTRWAAARDVDVIATGVNDDEHLELAGRAGISLVQGYRWGTWGSLEKLLVTWAR